MRSLQPKLLLLSWKQPPNKRLTRYQNAPGAARLRARFCVWRKIVSLETGMPGWLVVFRVP